MNKRNYQRELDRILDTIRERPASDGHLPALFLHVCCAPCSSYVLEYLSGYFEITVFFYNPNIYPPEEYAKRAEEEQRLIREMPLKNTVRFLEGTYCPEDFYSAVKGLEIDEGARPKANKRDIVDAARRRWRQAGRNVGP